MALANYVKFQRGTTLAYKKLAVKDPDTLYFIYETDDNKGVLYLGEKLITGGKLDGPISFNDLIEVLIGEDLVSDSVLVFDGTVWVNKPLAEVYQNFIGATENSAGVAGLVPAPAQNATDLWLRSDGTWAAANTVITIDNIDKEDHSVICAEMPTARRGDILIIKDIIVEDSDVRLYTAYVYDGFVWVAMDGNYSAESIYFKTDLLTTNAIGNITLTDGQATIAAAGKNLKQVWDTIFVKEEPAAVSKNPSVTVALIGADDEGNIKVEVGTKIIPQYSSAFDAGTYKYGPATDITVQTWTVTNSINDEFKDTEESSFSEIVVGDTTSFKVTSVATHTAGAIPVSNIGNPDESKAIAAGFKSGTSGAISGYRNTFYGTLENPPAELTSDDIRGLIPSNAALTDGDTWEMEIPVGAQCAIIAYPASLTDLNSVKDDNGLSAEIVTSFKKSTLEVEGANGHEPILYKVYRFDFITNGTLNKFTVTI